MNNSKSCVPYVCTGSGYKQVCERHDANINDRGESPAPDGGTNCPKRWVGYKWSESNLSEAICPKRVTN